MIGRESDSRTRRFAINRITLHGQQLIGETRSAEGTLKFRAVDAAGQIELETDFCEATAGEIDRALRLAADSFDILAATTPQQRASLLEAIADGVAAIGPTLLDRCHAETGLPMPRLVGEHARTINQTRLIASMIREGSWVEAKIDRAEPGRMPLPKPDVRSMLIGIGPIVVFGASNFPLAISVVGTDTVTALGAGCPVVVKSHPAHPGTCEMLGEVVRRAVAASGLPAGIFSLLHGRSHDTGRMLVEHPATRAVAFTGSLAGGRALMDIAARRPTPIPIYAEMGSVNPVFVLPGALHQRAESIAQGYIDSVTLGTGQFCTNPGLLFVQKSDACDQFLAAVERLVASSQPATMLHAGISRSFAAGIERLSKLPHERLLQPSAAHSLAERNQARCTLSILDVAQLADDSRSPNQTATQDLRLHELFGPYSSVILCDTLEQMAVIADRMDGQLTATVHGDDTDLSQIGPLLRVLRRKAGRILMNGFPTGVEVGYAIHHGGPFPAASDPHFTSIGPHAIKRFVRPVCFQGFPNSALPAELQDDNPRGILRQVDGQFTRSGM